MRAWLFAALIFTCCPLWAASWTGRVVGISDGDTITVLRDREPVKVRLVEIDAPEKRQAFGARAKQQLSDLVYDQDVRVEDQGQDRYRRTLGRVYVGNLDVNAEMVKRGFAWAYVKYLTDPRIAELEREARTAGRGLWADDAPEPPWEFRRR